MCYLVNNNPDDASHIDMEVKVNDCFLILPNKSNTNALCIEGEVIFIMLREKLSDIRKLKPLNNLVITKKEIKVSKLCFYMCKYSSINENFMLIQKRRMFDPLVASYEAKEYARYEKLPDMAREKYKCKLHSELKAVIKSADIAFTILDMNLIIGSVKEMIENIKTYYTDSMSEFNEFTTLKENENHFKPSEINRHNSFDEPINSPKRSMSSAQVKLALQRKPINLLFRQKCEKDMDTVDIHSDRLLLIILNTSQEELSLYPVFKITLSSFTYTGKDQEVNEADVLLKAHYYNPNAGYWEPFIEGSKIIYKLHKIGLNKSFCIFSEEPINLNVSEALIHCIQSTLASLSQEEPGKRKSKPSRFSRPRSNSSSAKKDPNKKLDIETPSILRCSNFTEYTMILKCNEIYYEIAANEEKNIIQDFAKALDIVVQESHTYYLSVMENKRVIINQKIIIPTINTIVESHGIDEPTFFISTKLNKDTMQKWIVFEPKIKLMNLSNKSIEVKIEERHVLGQDMFYYLKTEEMESIMEVIGAAKPFKYRINSGKMLSDKIDMKNGANFYSLYIKAIEVEKIFIIQFLSPLKIINYLPCDIYVQVNSTPSHVLKNNSVLINEISDDEITFNMRMGDNKISSKRVAIDLLALHQKVNQ